MGGAGGGPTGPPKAILVHGNSNIFQHRLSILIGPLIAQNVAHSASRPRAPYRATVSGRFASSASQPLDGNTIAALHTSVRHIC